jgi:hypothetical protein
VRLSHIRDRTVAYYLRFFEPNFFSLILVFVSLEIYLGGMTEHLAGWLSPTRYFYEALAVGEYRCLPAQSGFTVEDESVNFPRDSTILAIMGVAGHDPNASQQSCNGWYWSVLPSIFVGLTVRFAAGLAMHTFNRSQQTKKPLLFEMKRDRKVTIVVVAMCVALFGMGCLTTWLYSRDLEADFQTTELDDFTGDDDFVQGILVDANASSYFDFN